MREVWKKEIDDLTRELNDGSPESKAIFELAGVSPYETFVKLLLPEAVRKRSEEDYGTFLVYANNHTEWPLVDEFSDVPWLDAACALGYPVPEEGDEDE